MSLHKLGTPCRFCQCWAEETNLQSSRRTHGRVGCWSLLEECRFLRNPQFIFLKKEREPTTKLFDDGEWVRSLTEAEASTGDIPEGQVTCDQSADPKKVRPIQMGDFVREYVSRRLSALSEGEIAALMNGMRQVGVGSQGGAEALAIYHQLIFDEWMSGSLDTPLARIKVDENNFFGMNRVDFGEELGKQSSPLTRSSSSRESIALSP